MTSPNLLNEVNTIQSTSEEVKDDSNISELHGDNKTSTSFDLKKSEINKLFLIIAETDAESLNEMMTNENVVDGNHLFVTRPIRPIHSGSRSLVHLRESMYESTINWINILRNNQFGRSRLIRYPEAFRTKIVEKVISFIDSYSSRTLSKKEDLNDKCVICICNFELNDKIRKLNCSHKYHRICIDEWLVECYNCPICRTDLMGVGKICTGLSYLYGGRNHTSTVPVFSVPLRESTSSINILNNDSLYNEMMEVD